MSNVGISSSNYIVEGFINTGETLPRDGKRYVLLGQPSNADLVQVDSNIIHQSNDGQRSYTIKKNDIVMNIEKNGSDYYYISGSYEICLLHNIPIRVAGKLYYPVQNGWELLQADDIDGLSAVATSGSVNDLINLQNITQDIIPNDNNEINLGSNTQRFATIFTDWIDANHIKTTTGSIYIKMPDGSVFTWLSYQGTTMVTKVDVDQTWITQAQGTGSLEYQATGTGDVRFVSVGGDIILESLTGDYVLKALTVDLRANIIQAYNADGSCKTFDIGELTARGNATFKKNLTVEQGLYKIDNGVQRSVALLGSDDKLLQSQHRPSNVSFNANNGIFTFTWADGSTQAVDTTYEALFQASSFDVNTKLLTFTLAGGNTTTIDLSSLVDVAEIQISNQNPVANPTTGQKLYYNWSTNKWYYNVNNTWFGGTRGMSTNDFDNDLRKKLCISSMTADVNEYNLIANIAATLPGNNMPVYSTCYVRRGDANGSYYVLYVYDYINSVYSTIKKKDGSVLEINALPVGTSPIPSNATVTYTKDIKVEVILSNSVIDTYYLSNIINQNLIPTNINNAITTVSNRANHTGTQAVSTITGLSTVATSGSYNDLTNKPDLQNITSSNITINAGTTTDGYSVGGGGIRFNFPGTTSTYIILQPINQPGIHRFRCYYVFNNGAVVYETDILRFSSTNGSFISKFA
jgi:hypothetical protein